MPYWVITTQCYCINPRIKMSTLGREGDCANAAPQSSTVSSTVCPSATYKHQARLWMCECSCDAVCRATEPIQVLSMPPSVAIHNAKTPPGHTIALRTKTSAQLPAVRRSVEVNALILMHKHTR